MSPERTYRVTPLWVGGPRHGQVVTIETTADLPDWKVPLPSEPTVATPPDNGVDKVMFVMYRHGFLRTEWHVPETDQRVRLRCRIAYAPYRQWSEAELVAQWNLVVALVMGMRGWPGVDEGERWIVERTFA